ncbi:MAG: TetR/AcrR family transcriptional regulator [Verrucomicrobiales bacterium]|nr:TetR/AcrR family transcriptional regulator [Verrucomicrobiales bacterium]
MDEKQDKILEAALEVFLRYGFKKATMADIAEKAEMSRPSLYLVFSNKEEIFRAVMARKMEIFQLEAQAKVEQCTGLEARMTAILHTWILEPYTMVINSPGAEDLLGFVQSFATDLRKEMLGMIEAQLTAIIRSDPETDLTSAKAAGLEIETVARVISYSTTDLKYSVTDPEELEQLLAATVKIYVSFFRG